MQRRVVLFDADATFASKAKFFSEAKKRIYRSYGVTAWIHGGSDYSGSIRCSRCTNGCTYSLRIERRAVNEVWRLCADRCDWEHNHDMEGDEEERASWSSSDDEDEVELVAEAEQRARLRSRAVVQNEQPTSSAGTSVRRQKPTGTPPSINDRMGVALIFASSRHVQAVVRIHLFRDDEEARQGARRDLPVPTELRSKSGFLV